MSAALLEPAALPREGGERLLCIDPRAGRLADARVAELPHLLRPGDLLVVNDAATLPASLSGTDARGRRLEVRLLGRGGGGRWHALVFGAGDWRTPTERRPPAPGLARGAELRFGAGLRASVTSACPLSERVVELRFRPTGAAFWAALYAAGRPVQYSYLADDAPLEAFQTPYAGRPWAAEMPSAGRALRWEVLLALRARGVKLAVVTHAAGLSSSGDADLDAVFPFPEPFEVPERTVRRLAATRARGGRVIAVGTTATRALEGCAALHGGALAPGAGVTGLRIGPGFRPRVVDGLLSNLHEPGEPHFELLRAFAPRDLLLRAAAHARAAGYLRHEFGDVCLVLAE